MTRTKPGVSLPISWYMARATLCLHHQNLVNDVMAVVGHGGPKAQHLSPALTNTLDSVTMVKHLPMISFQSATVCGLETS